MFVATTTQTLTDCDKRSRHLLLSIITAIVSGGAASVKRQGHAWTNGGSSNQICKCGVVRDKHTVLQLKNYMFSQYQLKCEHNLSRPNNHS